MNRTALFNTTAALRSALHYRTSDGLDRRPAYVIQSFAYWFPVLWVLCVVGNTMVIVVLRRSLRPRRTCGGSSDDYERRIASVQRDQADNRTCSTPLSPGPGSGRTSTGSRPRLAVPKAAASLNSTTLCLIAISVVDMFTMTSGAVWMYFLFIRKERGLPFVLAYAAEHVTFQFSTWAEAYLSLTRCVAIVVPHRSKVLISTRSTVIVLLVFVLVICVTELPIYAARIVMLTKNSQATQTIEKTWFAKLETITDSALRYVLPLLVTLTSSAVIVGALVRRGSRFSLLSARVATDKPARSRPVSLLSTSSSLESRVCVYQSHHKVVVTAKLPVGAGAGTETVRAETRLTLPIHHVYLPASFTDPNVTKHLPKCASASVSVSNPADGLLNVDKSNHLLVPPFEAKVEPSPSSSAVEMRAVRGATKEVKRRCHGISIGHIVVVLLGKNLLFFLTSLPCLVCDLYIVFLTHSNSYPNGNTYAKYPRNTTATATMFANASNFTRPNGARQVMSTQEIEFVNMKNWFFVFHLFSFCDLSFSFFIYVMASHRFRNATLEILAPLKRRLTSLLRCTYIARCFNKLR